MVSEPPRGQMMAAVLNVIVAPTVKVDRVFLPSVIDFKAHIAIIGCSLVKG